MVSAEVSRKSGQIHFNLLCVDFMNSGERVVLEGSLDRQVYRGHIRLR
jgi:hypothetical protein